MRQAAFGILMDSLELASKGIRLCKPKGEYELK